MSGTRGMTYEYAWEWVSETLCALLSLDDWSLVLTDAEGLQEAVKCRYWLLEWSAS